MPRLEHVAGGTADEESHAHRVERVELEVPETLLCPTPRELARRVGLPGLAEHADRHDLPVTTIHELVGDESRLGADLLSELLVDETREIVHRPAFEAIPPDACNTSRSLDVGSLPAAVTAGGGRTSSLACRGGERKDAP